MEDPHSLSDRMIAVARELQALADAQAAFQRAVTMARSHVDGCDAAALSCVRARRELEPVASTDQMALVADRLQGELGEGPCLDAVRRAHLIHSPSLEEGIAIAAQVAVAVAGAEQMFTERREAP